MNMNDKIDSKNTKEKHTVSFVFNLMLKEIFLIMIFFFLLAKSNSEESLAFMNFMKLVFLFSGFVNVCLGFSSLATFFKRDRDLADLDRGLLFIFSGALYQLSVIVISNF